MKNEAVKDLSKGQLVDELIGARKTHMDLRFQQAAGQLENISLIKKTKRTIARLKTEIHTRKSKEGEKVNA